MQTATIILAVAMVIAAVIIANAIVTSARYKAGIQKDQQPLKLGSRFKAIIKHKYTRIIAAVLAIVLVSFFWGQDVLGFAGIHTITVKDIKVIENDGIGDDWEFSARLTDKNSKGSYIKFFANRFLSDDDFPVRIIASATELDSWNDFATNSVSIKSSDSRDLSIKVVVKELGTNQSLSKKAVVQFTFKIR